MAKRKTESALGLAALPVQSTFSSSMSLALSNNQRAVSKREREIFADLHEQEVVIDATASKSIFGMEKMNEVKRAAATDMLYTLQFLEETKTDTGLTSYQAIFEEFSNRVAALSGRSSLGVIEVSSHLIAEEIASSLYPVYEEPEAPKPPEPPKPFLVRLLGG